MNNIGFEIKTTKDFFGKLKEEYGEYCNNRSSSRVALNCAMTAWHLTDWVYHEFGEQLPSTYPKLSDFQSYVKTMCPSLQIMHYLSNGTKHYLLERHVPKIKNTTFHSGDFSDDFSNDFDVDSLNIELKDGRTYSFEDEMRSVVDFWQEYLKVNCNPAT